MGRKTRAHVLTVAVTTLVLGSLSAADESTPSSDSRATAQPASKRLDLRMPNITTLYTQEQIAVFLAKTRAENLEEVEVEGRREPKHSVSPDVWGGIAAPIWAVLHPMQAWRIFAPLPPDQLRRVHNPTPDATQPYQVTAARSARDL